MEYDTVRVKTAFVSGSTGFVGLALVEELTRQNWNVWALHRPGSNVRLLKRFPAHLVEGDITDRPSLLRAMPENIGVVFHVAGSTSLWPRRNRQQDQVNIAGTRNMVTAALQQQAVRFVHTSSISVYGLQRGRVNEDSPKLGEHSWINYQRSKYLAEQEVQAGLSRGLDAVVLNPASIIGRYDTRGYARLIKLVHQGRLPGVPPGKASFCHVQAVAKAHIAAAEHGGSGENYLLGGADASYMELVELIAEVADRTVSTKTTPAWLLKLLGKIGNAVSHVTRREPVITAEAAAMVCREIQCDSSKAERELGYQPASLEAMVEDSYRWLKKRGLLDA